jgi:hypothetical protein
MSKGFALVHYYRRNCPNFDAERGDTTTLELDNVTCDRCRPVTQQVDAVGSIALVDQQIDPLTVLKRTLISVALLIEDDGLPCWCAQIICGVGYHSEECLLARELTMDVPAHENTLDEQVYRGAPSVSPNENICPYCGSDKAVGLAPIQPTPQALGLNHYAEKLMKCLECGSEFVSVLAWRKNITTQASSRWSEAN